MAILHVANFHGMNQVIKPTGGLDVYGNVQPLTAIDTQITSINQQYYTVGIRTGQGVTGYVGRDPKNPDKSHMSIDPSTAVNPVLTTSILHGMQSGQGNFIYIHLHKIYNLMKTVAIGDVVVFGFRYTRECSNVNKEKSVAGIVGIINPTLHGTSTVSMTSPALYNNITYSFEVRMKKVSNTTFDYDQFLNKTRIGGFAGGPIVEYGVGHTTPTLFIVLDDNETKVMMSDFFYGYDKVTDVIKTDLAGPLDVRHHLATVATNVSDWKVVDGTPTSKINPDVTVLEALGDNDVGLHVTKYNTMTLAMTDPTGALGTFKFENVPAGTYLGYALDVFVNQPQSQSGDMYAEVFEGVNVNALTTSTVKNITRVPGNFQQVNITTQSKAVNQDNLHVVKLNIGSKKIVPE